jgi:flagellar motor switch/type III secretory pathway protein FliN
MPLPTTSSVLEKPHAAAASGNAPLGSAESEQRWQPVMGLPCEVSVEVALPNFTVSDFLKLQPGSIISSQWRVTQDIPLQVNGTVMGWAEFEGSGKRLAVRLTELA